MTYYTYMRNDSSATLYEFFAGGGMARLGLGRGWRCVFANDFDPMKALAYRAAFGDDHHVCGDVWRLCTADLPGRADLAWASSPCQDLSLAGRREGLAAPRSGAFWGFWRLIEGLSAEGRAPGTIVIENVVGLLSARGGEDFSGLCAALDRAGYGFGALEIDASLFVPQSRPRVFVVASLNSRRGPVERGPSGPFHSKAVQAAYRHLPSALQAGWRWWRLPTPPLRNTTLADVIESDGAWHRQDATERLVSMMAPPQRAKLEALVASGTRAVGAGFRRIRRENGERRQRFEARFDSLAGCLRTAGGGSSRQVLVEVDGGRVRTRLLTPREGARLMGLDDDYPLPAGQTAAFTLVGDGVVAPVAGWLGQHLLAPLCEAEAREARGDGR